MSIYNNFKYITFIVFFALSFCSYSVKGIVYDAKTKEALIGASVFIDETQRGTATNIDGQFSIIDIKPSEDNGCTLKSSYMGYQTFTKKIILNTSVLTIDIYLNPSNLEMDEIIITSQKRQDKVTDAPAAIELISSEDIKREESTNLGGYLKGIKGVDFTSSGINNYSISVRGFNSSFTTRLLTLTDGRIANIPALRVINYSLIPQSSKDIESIEVVLGPSTALYGANAHSGVVSINSKSPADSEGFDISLSSSINDNRDLYKIDTRWAKKINKALSFKFSASYLQGREWEFVSEEEYKLHTYPYSGFRERSIDKKDNNPWTNDYDPLITDINNSNEEVRIGDGEPFSEGDDNYDPDGDGVAGEDWFNGQDDDNDGLIDEDYFFSDGFDNDGDCEGDTNLDGCYCCGWNDVNKNKIWDENESGYGDKNVDENIDVPDDQWYDGFDNDGNGQIDDSQERDSGGPLPNWQVNLEDKNIIVFKGKELYLINGEINPWYVETGDLHIRGDHYYDEGLVEILFDNYIFDLGNDGIAGDNAWNDLAGDGIFNNAWEGGNKIAGGEFSGNNVPSEGCFEMFGANGVCDGNEIGVSWSSLTFDMGLDGIPNTNDLGEGDGIWNSFDWNNDGNYTQGDQWNSQSWIDNGDGVPNLSDTLTSFQWYDTYPFADGTYNPNGADGIAGTNDDEILYDYGQDGLGPNDDGYPGPDAGENDGIFIFLDNGEMDGIYDTGDGCFKCEAEPLTIDFNGNGIYDCPDPNDLNTCDNYDDINNDDNWTPADYKDNFQKISDVNGDGLNEYPDFEVKNAKAEFRLDYDPSRDFNLSFQTGYSESKTQQVTGFGRYLTDIYSYTYYQLRGRYKNWFSQIYLNQGNSGDTRGYLLGNVISDKSRNMAFQLQNNFKYKNTKFVWGLDYFTTIANTNGSILNDGPNGYDNDGDWWYAYANNIDDDFDSDDYQDINGNGQPDPGEPGVNNDGFVYADGIDNDQDGFDSDGDSYPNFIELHFGSDPDNFNDIPYSVNPQTGEQATLPFDPDWQSAAVDEMIDENWCGTQQYSMLVGVDQYSSTNRDGRAWSCLEGVDEPDEFLNVTSEEYGMYFQSKTNPFGNKKWEIITAARIDHHDQLNEDLQFSPKFGIFYMPNDYHTFRITYGKAYNTPSAITLYTDLFVDSRGGLEYYLRGNRDGTPYQRVGENYDVVPPQMEIDGEMHFIGADPNYWAGTGNYNTSYSDRVQGAPYFYALNADGFISTPDFIPIDTAIYTIWVPELNDTGRIYTPLEALNIVDVDPIKTEKIQTIEFGFKGFLTEKIHATIDYYSSFYEDFFSAPTVITPLVIERKFDSNNNDITNMDNITVVGLLTVNDFLSNPPYGTQWNGSDDDNDWSSNIAFPLFNNNLTQINSGVYSNSFEIDFNTPVYNIDTNSDGLMDAFDWSQTEGFGWADDESTIGEFGYVDYIRCPGNNQIFWNNGYSEADGLEEYCANNNYSGGDTVGITLYNPEDVINLEEGTVQFGSHQLPAQFWGTVGVDEYSTISGLSEAEIITSPVLGADGQPTQTPGFAYTPRHSVLAPLNYGKVNMQGIDIGLSYLFPEYNIIVSSNFSFYNSTEYYNKLTKKKDPINAPKFKMNASMSFSSEKYGNISIKYRHVDRFLWKDGLWSGYIGPYDLIDLLYSYKINEYLEINLTAQNIFNDVHKELIGGAKMGRQFILRLGASL